MSTSQKSKKKQIRQCVPIGNSHGFTVDPDDLDEVGFQKGDVGQVEAVDEDGEKYIKIRRIDVD